MAYGTLNKNDTPQATATRHSLLRKYVIINFGVAGSRFSHIAIRCNAWCCKPNKKMQMNSRNDMNGERFIRSNVVGMAMNRKGRPVILIEYQNNCNRGITCNTRLNMILLVHKGGSAK